MMTDPQNPDQYPTSPRSGPASGSWPSAAGDRHGPSTGSAPHHVTAAQPSAPTSPGAPTSPYGEHEYVVNNGSWAPREHASFRDAPDPFNGPSREGEDRTSDEATKGTKGWIIPVAAIVALAIIGAAVYFLFLQKDDTIVDRSAPSSNSSASASGSPESGSPGGGGTPPAIAGGYEVNGTIESYSGPSTGQLGGAVKKAGDPAFRTPQTWAIEGTCTDESSCELPLTVTPGDTKITLKLDGETWKGQGTETIQCNAAGQTAEATVAIEIPQAGGTAKRTVTATCSEPITEVDALTLTKK